MKKRLLIEIPGFSNRLLAMSPKLQKWAKANNKHNISPCIPALTLPAHASLVTGLTPTQHNVFANGSYYRDLNKVEMWPQSEAIIKGQKIWQKAQKTNKDFKSFKYFFWPGMKSTADLYANVRPVYFADGRKQGGVYFNLPNLSKEIEQIYGKFPLFNFWGPNANIKSSQWILDTARHCLQLEDFNLSFIYVPHLDYKQQSLGPNHSQIKQEVTQLDDILMPFIDEHQNEYDIILLSSYHINQVNTPIHINRILRNHGFLKTTSNEAGELIDYGLSTAFSVSDHQIAQIYINDHKVKNDVCNLLQTITDIDHITHYNNNDNTTPDLICFAKENAWFTYYYWLDENNAPDFATTIAIHSKCGYDPCELLINPKLKYPKLKIAWQLLKKHIGMRYLMDIIPTDAKLIKGSHGLAPTKAEDYPICIHNCQTDLPHNTTLQMSNITDLLLNP